MKKGTRALLVAAGVVAAVAVVAGGGDLTDPRDGQKYRTVKIGDIVWMAENLNYKPEISWCYGDDESNCKKYGRLYDWQSAKAACPSGWHLPSSGEWNKLIAATGGAKLAGKKLKAKSGWSENGNGTDDYGFSALPGGFRNDYGRFTYADYGYWWSATESGGGKAYGRYMNYHNDYLLDYTGDVQNGLSVRCVED